MLSPRRTTGGPQQQEFYSRSTEDRRGGGEAAHKRLLRRRLGVVLGLLAAPFGRGLTLFCTLPSRALVRDIVHGATGLWRHPNGAAEMSLKLKSRMRSPGANATLAREGHQGEERHIQFNSTDRSRRNQRLVCSVNIPDPSRLAM